MENIEWNFSMADMFSKKKRSEIMSKIRSKNTAPEKLLFSNIKHLYKKGFRYRKHPKQIIGKPDLAFTTRKVAVFVDSEFWHGRNFNMWKNRLPKQYWREKIHKNIKRDRAVNKELRQKGWQVIRIWAKDLKKNTENQIRVIEKALDVDR